MVDIIIFLQSQKKDPWLSVPRLFMVGFMGNLLLGILFNINFSGKRTNM
jgi:hypothetical protein